MRESVGRSALGLAALVGTALVVAACESPMTDRDAAPVVPFLPSGRRADGVTLPPAPSTSPHDVTAGIRTEDPGYAYEVTVVTTWPAPQNAIVKLIDPDSLQSDSFYVDWLQGSVDTHAYGQFSLKVADEASTISCGAECSGSVYPEGSRVRVEIYIYSEQAAATAGEIELGLATPP